MQGYHRIVRSHLQIKVKSELEIEIYSRHQHDEGRYTFCLCMSTLWRPYICKVYWNKLFRSKESHFVSTWLRCRSTMTACNDRRRRWVDSRSVVRLVEQVLLHEQEMCFLRRAATVEMGNDRCVGVISQTTKTSKRQRKPGAKSCLESSASVIPFVQWNRYHRQMYSTSWIDARDNSDQEEPSVHKNPRLHILQDGGFIWILMRTEPKFAHAQVVT